MRLALLPVVLLTLAFAPAPLPRRGPATDYQKVADAAPWLSPKEGAAKTSIERGGVLYRAEFRPHANGCAVVAYDLGTRGRLWRSQRGGLGLVSHSDYSNAVRVEPVGAEALAV
jgi:hypothetical protein